MSVPPESGSPATSVKTFLVADIRGYTAFTKRHGDEAAARLVRHFGQVVAEGIAAWAGTVVETRGDEALAVFESSRGALHAAVELQAAFADETAADPELPLEVGIGLDAGEAVPHGEGYRGAALNTASRLCGQAAAGQTYASAGLIHLSGAVSGLDFGPAEPLRLRGLAQPVEAVPVTSQVTRAASRADGRQEGWATSLPSALPPELDPIVPLADRTNEELWLEWHWRRARHGHGRTVLLTGPPGIGKTRLAAELAAHARAEAAFIRYLPGARGVDDVSLLGDASTAPTLIVVDDLDAAPARLVSATVELSQAAAACPALILVIHRTEASPAISEIAQQLTSPERRRELGPLDLEAVRMIAALYAGDAVDELPLARLVEETGGHPAAVHRTAHQWSRLYLAQRIGRAAERTAVTSSGTRGAELELTDDIVVFQQARERGLLLGLGNDPDAAGLGEGGEPGPRPSMCPYKGLATYETADAGLFFGRERLIADLTVRLVGHPILGIVGASGSGKSSAVLAGLLPALAGGVLPGSEAWVQVVIRPGARPMQALASALTRAIDGLDEVPPDGDIVSAALELVPAGSRLVLFVDQLEEVFSASDPNARAAFIDTITEERPGFLVIVAMRVDHYGAAAEYPRLARAVASNQVLVGALTPSELAAIVERPAEYAGLRVEPELTRALTADAGVEAQVLPLLSTSLLELWSARDDGHLTLAAYRAGGGLDGSIARMAEAAWAPLDPDRQAVAKAILLRLSGAGEGDDLVRRRVPLEELDLGANPLAQNVLDRLVSARLLSIGDGEVEVVHEALLREWPRLRGWLEQDVEGHRLQLQLAAAARQWAADGREAGDLYRGTRLVAALDWAADHPSLVNALEREFLDASGEAAERDAERQRRTNRRLRALVAGISGVLMVALLAGVYAFGEAQRADRETEQAEVARDQARSRQLAAAALIALDDDPALSKLLAAEAATLGEPTPEAVRALHTALATDLWVDTIDLTPYPASAPAVSVDPSGRWLVESGWDGPRDAIRLLDRETGDEVWRATMPVGALVWRAFFTPSGDRIVAGVVPDPTSETVAPGLGIGSWDATSGTPTAEPIDVGRCGARVVGVSDEAAVVQIPALADDGVACWEAPLRLESVSLLDGSRSVISEAIEQDGARVSSNGAYLALQDPGTDGITVVGIPGQERWTLPAIPGFDVVGPVQDDGSTLVLASSSNLGDLIAVDLPSGRPRDRVRAHAGEIWWAEFMPSSAVVVSMGDDGRLARWDTADGQQWPPIPSAGSGWPVPITPTMIGAVDVGRSRPMMRLFTTESPTERHAVVDFCEGEPHEFPLQAQSFAVHEGVAYAETGCDYPNAIETRAVELATGRTLFNVPGMTGRSHVLAPDGQAIARQASPAPGWAGTIELLDAADGRVLKRLEGLCDWDEGHYDDAKGQPPEAYGDCAAFPESPFPFLVPAIRWSPDGHRISAQNDVGYGGAIAAWDVDSGELTGTIDFDAVSGQRLIDHLYSPDGERVYVTSIVGGQAVSHDAIGLYAAGSLEPLTQAVELRTADGSGATWPPGVSLAGVSEDGSTLYGVAGFDHLAGGDALLWIDAQQLTVERVLPRISEAANKSMALSPDRTRLAIGSADGHIRVWDLSAGRLVHEIAFQNVYPGSIKGVAWVDEVHLEAALSSGLVVGFTTDVNELLDLTEQSSSRGFNTTECATYGLDPCPDFPVGAA